MDQLTDADRLELESWLDFLNAQPPQPTTQPQPRQYRSLGNMARNDPELYFRLMFGDERSDDR